MQYALTVQKLNQAFQKQKLFVILLSASLGINLLQGFDRLLSSEKTIILPPDVSQGVWIQGNKVSASYLEEWSYYLCQLLLSTSPKTIHYQMDLALRHVSPALYGSLKRQLMQEAEHLKKHNASHTFQPKEVVVNEKNLTVRVTGTLSSFVGKDRIHDQQQTYEMTFQMSRGRFLHLMRFESLSHIKESQEEKSHDLTSNLS